ncbi:hypothetical protein KGF54_002885 [Candida jiufengensis]|uniref:uncharacterized protein n=1 Tax=Candida jiufengensis TaxID=497108 RepID=UPI002224FE13|nr:uncharacterized protein KGF54_002885 [Candida jiufengensis]KAI5953513.1 hypothetical protein KGF54_002885 [Candida jiufengensis]
MAKLENCNIYTTSYFNCEFDDEGNVDGFGGIGTCSLILNIFDKTYAMSDLESKNDEYRTGMRTSLWSIIIAMENILEELDENSYEGVKFTLNTDCLNSINMIKKIPDYKKKYGQDSTNWKNSRGEYIDGKLLEKIDNLKTKLRARCKNEELGDFELKYMKKADNLGYKFAREWAEEGADLDENNSSD